MTNTECARDLLKYIGADLERDRVIARAVMALLEPETPKAEPVKKAAAASTATKKVDHGKICALYKANWSIKAIADELNCNQATVRYWLKKEGLIK